jgi:hypothetical protein
MRIVLSILLGWRHVSIYFRLDCKGLGGLHIVDVRTAQDETVFWNLLC